MRDDMSEVNGEAGAWAPCAAMFELPGKPCRQHRGGLVSRAKLDEYSCQNH